MGEIQDDTHLFNPEIATVMETEPTRSIMNRWPNVDAGREERMKTAVLKALRSAGLPLFERWEDMMLQLTDCPFALAPCIWVYQKEDKSTRALLLPGGGVVSFARELDSDKAEKARELVKQAEPILKAGDPAELAKLKQSVLVELKADKVPLPPNLLPEDLNLRMEKSSKNMSVVFPGKTYLGQRASKKFGNVPINGYVIYAYGEIGLYPGSPELPEWLADWYGKADFSAERASHILPGVIRIYGQP
jgi:hypothetical protein